MKLFNIVANAYKTFFQHLMHGKNEYDKISNSSSFNQYDHNDELIESVINSFQKILILIIFFKLSINQFLMQFSLLY